MKFKVWDEVYGAEPWAQEREARSATEAARRYATSNLDVYLLGHPIMTRDEHGTLQRHFFEGVRP